MSDYVIRGGEAGKRRLALLARTLWPTTSRLLHSAGLAAGMRCLDLGCGGGDVALEMAVLAAPGGSVLGLDLDAAKLELARAEARQRGLANVELRQADVTEWRESEAYDFAYCRFLLTHLRDPGEILRRLWLAVRPGGRVVVEDIDFAGHFCHPPSAAFARYLELYRAVVARRGGDADIGPKLHAMAIAAGWQDLALEVVQPAFVAGEGKQMALVTFANIRAAILAEGLAEEEELAAVEAQLEAFTRDPASLISLPRIFQLRAVRRAS